MIGGRRALPRCAERMTVADNDELVIRFHVVAGEDISVISRDFSDDKEALTVIAEAVNAHRSLLLPEARYDRETDITGVVINLANVVSVRVSKKDSAQTGQYL
jgi:hypothetical protein